MAPQDAVELLSGHPSASIVTIVGLLALVLAPVFEETLFRGFAYPALKRWLGPGISALIVSLVFALLHMSLLAFVPLVVLGLVLVVAYEATGSLLVPIFIHSGFNAISFARLLIQPGAS